MGLQVKVGLGHQFLPPLALFGNRALKYFAPGWDVQDGCLLPSSIELKVGVFEVGFTSLL